MKFLRREKLNFQQESITDSITGLYNKKHLENVLPVIIQRANKENKPLALLFFDIDDFKKFNDKFGHPEGDRVITYLGRNVKNLLRDTDYGFRYGGEEFVVVLQDADEETGVKVANRIKSSFNRICFNPGLLNEAVCKTLSIGVAVLTEDDDMISLINKADQAMHKAKNSGKDRVEVFR